MPLFQHPIKFGLFYIFAVSLLGCGKNDLEKVQALAEQDLPMEEGRNVQVIYTDSARLKAKVHATVLEKRKDGDKGPYLKMKEGVKARFYNDKGELSSRLRADKGKRYLDHHRTIVRENVVVVNRKNDTLSTEEMIWNEKENRIYSEKFVKVRTAEEIIYANGFESDPSFTEYEFYDIEGTISVDNPQEE